MTVVLLPSIGELPDVFTDIVQELPAAKVVPLFGRLPAQIAACEKFLDKHELRRDIIFLTRGTGGIVAQAVTARRRTAVRTIIALGYPRFRFGLKRLIPADVSVTQVATAAEALALVDELQNQTPHSPQ